MSKRYIDADALISDIETSIETYWNGGGGGHYLAEDVLNYSVKTAPIADVVEVVRCRDCKYWATGYGYCRRMGVDSYGDSPVGRNDFCSYGERRAGEDEQL